MIPPDERAGPPHAPVATRLDLDTIEADLDAIEAHLAQIDDQPATPGADRA